MKTISTLWVFCTFLIFPFAVFGQGILSSYQVSNPGNIEDLWTVELTGTAGHKYNIVLELFDEKQSLLVKQKSKDILLTASAPISLLHSDLIRPIQVLYTSPDFLKKYNVSAAGFPVGRYKVRFTLFEVISPTEPVSETSYDFDNLQNLNLIQIAPFDGQVLMDPLPNFMWKLIGEVTNKDCSIELVVKEIQNGQLAQEAMMNNQVYFSMKGKGESYLYNIADRAFKSGRSYVWTVSYLCGGLTTLNSEFWTFSIKDNVKKPTSFIDPKTFYKVQEAEDAGVAVAEDNYLNVKFLNSLPDKDGKLSYKVIDNKGKEVFSDKEIPLKVVFGENRYMIGLCAETGVYVKPGIYKMIITTDSERKYYLNFSVKPKNPCE